MITGDLDWIMMKALDKDRERRYKTANALALDIRRYLDEEPVLARPPSRGYLFSKLVRRNRLLFAAAGVALFGLIAGITVATWLYIREREARQVQARLRADAETARSVAEGALANEAKLNRQTQAADLVAQAAVFLRYNEMDEAEELLSDLDVAYAPASLEAAYTLTQVANSNLAKQRWVQAADRFHALVHVYANVDPKDTNANSQEWLPAAPAVFEWGKPEQYDELRNLAISRFANSSNPIVAEHLLKVSLLGPVDDGILRCLVPASEVIKASLADEAIEKDAHVAAWGQCALALFSFRKEEWGAAEKWARLSQETSKDPARSLWNKTILAMIAVQQGDLAGGTKLVDEVREPLRQWEKAPLRLDGSNRLSWSNWGGARILLREAESMIAPAKRPPPK